MLPILLLVSASFAQSDLFGSSLLGSFGDIESQLEDRDRAMEAAEAAMARDDFAEALKQYEEAAGVGALGLGATEQCGMARAAEALGLMDEALEHWQSCDENSLTGSALTGGALVGSALGYEPDPRDYAAERRSTMPELIRLRTLGRSELEAGQHAEAYNALNRANELDNHCPGRRCAPWTLRAIARASAGIEDFERARGFYERYLEARPDAWDLETVQAEIEALDQAEAAFQQRRVDTALRIDRTWAEPPGWLMAPNGARPHGFERQDSVTQYAIGRHGPSGAWYGLDPEGLVGPLALPGDVSWVELSESGVIYAQTDDGTLHRAASLRQATHATAFDSVGGFPDTTWDSAGDTLVGLREGEVVVSVDAARTIVRRPIEASHAFARADGTAVVREVDGALHVSRDGGTSWERTQGLGSQGLDRWGSFIGFVHREEMVYTGSIYGGPDYEWVCAEGVLAGDGRTWMPWGDGPGSEGRSPDPVELYSGPATADWDRDLFPKAPSAVGETAAEAIARCKEDPDAYHGGRGGAGGLAGGGGPAFDLRGLPSARADIQHGFLGDASCTGENCKPKTRGTLVRTDPGGVTGIPLPRSCNPRQVEDLGGLGGVECWGSELLLLDPDGAIVETLELGEGLKDSTVAPDGALLLNTWKHAWVRRPELLGDVDAWRRVTHPDAIAYRPAPGGAVLVLTSNLKHYQHRQDDSVLSLWLDDGELRPLVQDVPLPEDTIVDLRIREDGVVEIITEEWREEQRCLVLSDGSGLDCQAER